MHHVLAPGKGAPYVDGESQSNHVLLDHSGLCSCDT